MIVVIADDLSGAAELANAAVQFGRSAEVQMRFHAATDADVICVDTETRSLSPEAAAARVEEVARSVATIRPKLVYKKCDSVLRGPVAAESLAISRALGKERVLLVSANPSRQRIIRGGQYFVAGTPLAQSPFASDPEHPRQTSSVVELLGNASGIETPDVTSAEDLERLAATVDVDTLPAGAVDFFNALLFKHSARGELRPPTQPSGSSLFVCGSNSAWQAGRNEQCARHGIQICAMPRGLFERELREDILSRWAATAIAALRERGSALLAIGGEEPVPGLTPAMLADRMAQAVELTLEQSEAARVFLEGGATAAAVVQQLGFQRFHAQTSPGAGVGALLPAGQERPLFLIKPGSYPWPEAVWP
jgi:D-threonate/D-erythronate kinase